MVQFPTSLFGTVAPQFVVRDVEETALYYRDQLGFKVSGIYGEPVELAIVTRGNAQVFFSRALASPGSSNRLLNGQGVDAYFRVQGVEALQQELTQRGVLILDGPNLRNYGMLEIKVEDLNGFILVFGEERS